MKSHKPRNIKNHNLNVLRSVLRENRSLSTKDLSAISGLSVVSINKLLSELVETGEVTIQENPAITGGRRASIYQFNQHFTHFLVIQFTEKNQDIIALFHVCNLFGEVIEEKEFTKDDLIWDLLKQNISVFIEKDPAIKSIVFGIPGVEIEEKLKIMDFEPLSHLNLRQLVQEKFGIQVIIENDINAATLGYAVELNTSDEIYVSLYYPENYPPGAGIVYDGKLFRGKHGLSGEIKHLPLTSNEDIFPKPKEVLVKNIHEALQVVISMYDPTRIVIYTNHLDFSKDDLENISTELTQVFPYFELTDLRLAESFQEDYLRGLIHLGLENLIHYME